MNQNATEQAMTRTEVFQCDGPAELDVRIRNGRLDVRAIHVPGIRVRIAIAPDDAPRWEQGVEKMLHGVSGGQYQPSEADVHTLRETQIFFSEERRRLVVRTPRSFRRISLAVEIEVPEQSRLATRIHRGSVTVSGSLAELNAATGSGDISAERVDGDVAVGTSSGDLRLGRVAGRLRSRSGSGEIEIVSLDGEEAKLATGSGDIWLGVVRSDVHARTGSGSVVVAEAALGRLDLLTGSGNVNVFVRPGVAAEIDLASGSGRTRTELDVLDRPPADAPPLRIRARTGSGDAVIARTDG